MPLIQPFAALTPAPGRAGEVAAPPYDVVSAAEARQLAQGRPWSFLHISRAEIDLPPDTDPYATAVYAKARENLDRMCAGGVLRQAPAPLFFAYRIDAGAHRQTGLVAAASVAAYDSGRIKRHELTRPAKEDDRVRQIDALDAQTGPVLLAYRDQAALDALLGAACAGEPHADVVTDDGARHRLYAIADPTAIDAIGAQVEATAALYVADGHHRSAAASRIAAARRASDPDPAAAHQYFLAVLFPHSQMRILPYNRVVRDLHGLDSAAFLNRLETAFRCEHQGAPVQPQAPGEFGLFLDDNWYRLTLDPARIPAEDPVRRLDVSLLQDHLIEPILGITDPRRDPRIDFVGGSRGLDGLAARVRAGDARAAFALRATPMDALMSVADAGQMMPPKSTWFDPKLADGLVSHRLR